MKNRPAHECVSPVLTPTPSPYRQVRERGFERTTIAQIADAAEISRRTFFRCFADKEEVCFAEDERLLAVIDETLDSAPDGEPVLDLPAARLGPLPPTAPPIPGAAWPTSG